VKSSTERDKDKKDKLTTSDTGYSESDSSTQSNPEIFIYGDLTIHQQIKGESTRFI
jgi:hypothetical protein